MTRGPEYPLDRSLPAEVATSGPHLIAYYQQYPVFSWPWSVRRTLVFSPLIVAASVLFALSHVAAVHDWWDAASVGWREMLANAVLIVAGPFLATAIRQCRLRLPLERALVVMAVVMGIASGIALRIWAGEYHEARMVAHGMVHSQMPGLPAFETGLLAAIELVVQLAILTLLGGGFALIPYFSEPRRWREFQSRRELDRLRLQKDATDLELAVLQAQVEPHFLFNTLASVRSLTHSDPARAARTVDALVEYLRATLPKLRAGGAGLAPSTLAEQFSICESYLTVMQVRMGERLSVHVELPEHLRVVPFPPLLLISLVENAVKHGLEPKPGPVSISIHAEVRGIRGQQQLVVTVEDDGVGLSPGFGSGMGLANVRAQLAHRYGDAASLELEGRSGGGAIARISIPCESPA